MYIDSTMNCEVNFDEARHCVQKQSIPRCPSIINPEYLSKIDYPSPPAIFKQISRNNMPYDEELFVEDDLLELSICEYELEDSYDEAFTNLMVENFTYIKNPNYISPPDSGTKNKNEIFIFKPPTPPKNSSKTSLDSLDYSDVTSYCLDNGDGIFEYIDVK